jgi:hypothetical protein
MEITSPGCAYEFAVARAHGEPGVQVVPDPLGLTEYVTAAAGTAHRLATAAIRMRRDFTD